MDGGFLCLLVVIGFVAYLVYRASERSNKKYRSVCGECRFATEWLTESGAANRISAHYRTAHPTIAPGGQVEIR
ncbi:hypothetical protein AB0L82_35680 [Nocardia sp. NPDC052001]|uniref:hypothetical protein n=1 Tax=Nocardia sp. NPDC052001 TaxID=3154853 RepID=UPI003419DDE4